MHQKISHHHPQQQAPFQKPLELETRWNKDRNWTQIQLYRLHLFLEQHGDSLRNEQTRKATKIYKKMSVYVQSKNTSQCRSYIKKLLNKFNNINVLLQFLAESLPRQQETQNQQNQYKRGSSVHGLIQAQNVNQRIDKMQKHKKLHKEKLHPQQRLLTEKYLQALQQEEEEDDSNKANEKLKPTDVCYHESEQYHPTPLQAYSGTYMFSQSLKYQENNSLKTLQQMNKINANLGLIEGHFSTFKEVAISSEAQSQKKVEKEYIKDFFECHQIWLTWTLKLSQLESRMSNFYPPSFL